MLESLSPELVYATKGNIAYPLSGGIDGVQSVAALAALAQIRLADAVAGSLGSGYGKITTAIAASTATTSLAVAGGFVMNSANGQVPSGAMVVVIANGNVVSVPTTAAVANGATSVAVSSFTVPWAIPVGAEVVYGEVAAALGPGPVIAAQ